MLRPRLWNSTSKRLGLLLLAVVVPPAVTLIWLGAQLVEQDRVVIAQRELEGRTAIGQAAALAMRQALGEAQRLFEGGVPPGGIVRLSIADEGMDVTPRDRVLWTPTPPRLPTAADDLFVGATRLEYQGDVAGALNVYERAAAGPDRAVRAGALRRIARLHWRERRWDDALVTYRALAQLRDVSDLGMPADLLARRNAIDVLAAAGRSEDVGREARRLQDDLLSATWLIDRDSWDLAVHDLERWLGTRIGVPAERLLFTGVAERVWREFRSDVSLHTAPHRVIEVDGTPVTLLTRRTDGVVEVLGVAPSALQTWIRNVGGSALPDEVELALIGPSGGVVAGTPPPSGAPVVTVRASDVALPWTLTLHSDKWSQAGKQFAYRRQLLSIGLASILVLLAGGSYFLWRVVQRELAVSRLQTDFVAAVSHEFRTPLTALQHVTELLEEDDDIPAERRRSFYGVYRRNTERLHQLVESLLDFARMEAGRKVYERQPIDVVALAAHVVAEFRRHAPLDSARIGFDTTDVPGLIDGDRNALVNALWNLLDNAVKYSPAGGPIQVSVAAHPRGVAVAVKDAGLGIASHERRTIFQRFVRGGQAVALGIKGTGLGLAMVAHIAEAHGGAVELESEPGQGSTFRLILPAAGAFAPNAAHYKPA